jgi:PAS domain S-box-containing protein
MSIIPTRSDASDSARRTINKYFLLVAGHAFADVKRACTSNPFAFRYIGDLLLAEAQFFRNCTDYSFFRRNAVDTPARGPMLAIICAQTHQWLRADRALEAYLGYTREEMEADWVVSLHPDTCRETDLHITQIYRDLQSGKMPYCRAEVRYQTREGYSVWAQVTHSLVRDAYGRPDRYVLAIEDISLARWNELFYNELVGLRRIMDLSAYQGPCLARVEGILRHYNGETVELAVLGELAGLLTSTAA